MNLESPTSVDMQQRFLLSQPDAEFEGYMSIINKKRKENMHRGGPHPACAQAFGLLPPSEHLCGSRQAGNHPAARDGHSSELYGDFFFVFGGDRH